MAAGKVPIFGICGGYQMLGCEIADPDSVEEGGQIRGMELLPVRTVLQKEKHRCQTDGKLDAVEGIFSGLTGYEFTGYEIHMGETVYCGEDGKRSTSRADDAMRNSKNYRNCSQRFDRVRLRFLHPRPVRQRRDCRAYDTDSGTGKRHHLGGRRLGRLPHH